MADQSEYLAAVTGSLADQWCHLQQVRGVEGVVAVVVVSGLRQEQDHGIIVQAVGEMLEEIREELEDEMAESEKKKED